MKGEAGTEEKRRGGTDIKENIKVKEKYRNTSVKSKYFVLMICMFAGVKKGKFQSGDFKVGNYGCLGREKKTGPGFVFNTS